MTDISVTAGPTDREVVPSKLTTAESEIEQWLADAGIEGVPGLAVVLAKLGGGGVDHLRGVREAELLMSAGKLGLKGMKLRKLIAALGTTPRFSIVAPIEDTSTGGSDSGTGGSAFEYLVAKDGPPVQSTPQAQSPSSDHTAVDISDSRAGPSVDALPATPATPFALALQTPAQDSEEAPVFNFTPRTVEAIKGATGEEDIPPGVFTPRTIEAVKVAHQESVTNQALEDDETIALQLQLQLDEEASAEVVEETMNLAKKIATKGKPVKKKKSPKKKEARKANSEKTTCRFHVDVSAGRGSTPRPLRPPPEPSERSHQSHTPRQLPPRLYPPRLGPPRLGRPACASPRLCCSVITA